MQNEINTSSIILPPPQDIVNNSVSNNVTQDSIFSYFWDASFMIKVVLLALLVASIYSWAIIISKYFTIRRITRAADDFEESFWSGTPLDILYKQMRNSVFDPLSNVFCAAMDELEQSHQQLEQSRQQLEQSRQQLEQSRQQLGQLHQQFEQSNVNHSDAYQSVTDECRLQQSQLIPNNDITTRIERAMRIAIQKEINELENGLSFLSAIGNNGVIIGLLGTVIGISNGFKVIAAQQSASITTVGPVISEALFTTAFGVLTAIPAAFAYNKYMDSINRYVSRLEIFSDEFISIVTRQYYEN